MEPDPTVVVGAGPAGLAAAAMLGRRGIDAVVLERGDGPATSWRGDYDGLRLHTVRSLSSLPDAALPRSLGRWVARDAFVAYLEAYAASHRLRVRPGTTVRRIDRSPAGFTLETTEGPVRARSVVIATGYTRAPVIPAWPGSHCTGCRRRCPMRLPRWSDARSSATSAPRGCLGSAIRCSAGAGARGRCRSSMPASPRICAMAPSGSSRGLRVRRRMGAA